MQKLFTIRRVGALSTARARVFRCHVPWEVPLANVCLACFDRRQQGLLLPVHRWYFRLDLLGAFVLARPHLSWVLCGANPHWKGYFFQHFHSALRMSSSFLAVVHIVVVGWFHRAVRRQ